MSCKRKFTTPTQEEPVWKHKFVTLLGKNSVANLCSNVNNFVTERGLEMLSNIRTLCKEQGIAVAELERRCGLKPRTIYRWDVHAPSVDKAQRVADYFGITVDKLLKEED